MRSWIAAGIATLALAVAPAAQAAPPNVYPNVGTHASQTPITVSFVTDEPVTIRYTTDGSVPSAASPTYASPLTFTTTTVLRWIATDADGETTSGQETYTIDRNPPEIFITAPTSGASFTQHSAVPAYYWCTDAEINWTSCQGPVEYGGNLDTGTAGLKTFTVVAYDAAGNRAERSVSYTVNPATQTGGGVTGSVPATLNLTLGSAPSFGPFQPGVDREYTSSTVATVLSTAGDATLSVSDPSSFATGHLVNGTFALARPLQASGGGAFAPVGGSSAPTVLKTYSGPVANDATTLTFKQAIAATDPLRTGTYSKTLTFTLSTTQP